eukprot:jgi/Orpsp1_1/1188983/evm.model.d7180000068662.1
MIISSHNSHLKVIWNHYIYDNSFIINILKKRKEGIFYTLNQWENFLKEEKRKLYISDSIYETVFENKNWEALQLFLNNDGREQKITIFDMIEENEALEKAIDNQDLPTIQAISNFGYALNYKTFNFEELIMKAYSKMDKNIWKTLVKTSILSFQEKEKKLIESYNNNFKENLVIEDFISEKLNNDLNINDDDIGKIDRNLNDITEEDLDINNEEPGENKNNTTNIIIKKEDEPIDFSIKNIVSSNNEKGNLNSNANFKHRTSLGYDTYKRYNLVDESFLTSGEASREFITDASPIVHSAYRDLVGESPFINEPSQNFIDDDSKLIFPRMNPDIKIDSLPIENPQLNSNPIIISPPLAFDKINQNQNISNMSIKSNNSPSLAFDRINQNITIASPPLELHKGKNYYLYLIREIFKESHYNSSFLLNMTIRWHCEPLIKYLIEGDNEFKPHVNINAKDINGNYPLITFIRSDRCSHLNLLLYLLEKGADPNVKDNNGYSPLIISIQKEFEMGENVPTSYVQVLIEHGADINEKDANGNSILSLAVQKNCVRLVDFFLKHGCSMDEKDASGNYPVMVAISQNQYEIVKLFMRYGKKNHQMKNFSIHDINGNTPLILAYKLRLNSIFRYLLKYLDINFRDAQGKSLLFHALEKNDKKVVNYLIQVGAEVNQEDNLGNSPLIYAIKRGSLFLVQNLVEHGANINVKDRSGT